MRAGAPANLADHSSRQVLDGSAARSGVDERLNGTDLVRHMRILPGDTGPGTVHDGTGSG